MTTRGINIQNPNIKRTITTVRGSFKKKLFLPLISIKILLHVSITLHIASKIPSKLLFDL